MKILIISFYYHPDLCAGSFRTTAFVKALKAGISSSDTIDIITTYPNRYSSYRPETSEVQNDGNISIKRINVPGHKSGFIDQTRSFFVFFTKTLQFIMRKEYDVIFATSSRLFTAFLGAVISKWKRAPLYLDIRDIFTETLQSVLNGKKAKCMVPLFLMIEKYTIESAGRVNLVSKGFAPYFQGAYRNNYTYFTNGIDDDFLGREFAGRTPRMPEKIIFTYTGNIGEGQGLEKIVPAIAEKHKNIEFVIIGDGGRINILKRKIAHLANVKLIPPVTRSELITYYEKSTVLFLHLNDYEAFKKVLPSKLFEYAAMYKPIVAGVDGYAKEFLEENLPDSMVFRPCDADDFERKFEQFNGVVDSERRKIFINRFSRKNIMEAMSADLLEFARTRVVKQTVQ